MNDSPLLGEAGSAVPVGGRTASDERAVVDEGAAVDEGAMVGDVAAFDKGSGVDEVMFFPLPSVAVVDGGSPRGLGTEVEMGGV